MHDVVLNIVRKKKTPPSLRIQATQVKHKIKRFEQIKHAQYVIMYLKSMPFGEIYSHVSK
jgi:hypothetical protein